MERDIIAGTQSRNEGFGVVTWADKRAATPDDKDLETLGVIISGGFPADRLLVPELVRGYWQYSIVQG